MIDVGGFSVLVAGGGCFGLISLLLVVSVDGFLGLVATGSGCGCI